MTLPRGSVWQGLRAAALDAVPTGTRVDWSRPVTLAAWQARGYFSVATNSVSGFTLTAASTDIGGALLTDTEFFLDHAAEHQVTFWRHLHSDHWLSPAWLVVTLYYWGYFLTLALTRLMGRSVWFLTRDIVRAFVRLSPVPSMRSPGGGTFVLECGSFQGAIERELRLVRTHARVHEAACQQLWREFDLALRSVPKGLGNSLENRLYTALVRAGQRLRPDWPSEFRNHINYRPGVGYTAVRRLRGLTGMGHLRPPACLSAAEMIDRLENAVASVIAVGNLVDEPQLVAELLAYHVFALDAIVSELHRDVVERHNLDSRWLKARTTFLQQQGLLTTQGRWPTSGAA